MDFISVGNVSEKRQRKWVLGNIHRRLKRNVE